MSERSLAPLLAALEDDAGKTASRLREEAEREAQEVLKSAASEVETAFARGLAERRTAFAHDASQRLVEAREAARSAELEARARLLARVREAATEELLRRAARGELSEELDSLRRQAETAFGGRPFAVETGAAGAVLRASDDSLIVAATLPAALEVAWPQLAIDILREVER